MGSDNSFVGNHIGVPTPEAFSWMLSPGQTHKSSPASIIGNGLTVKIIESESVQPKTSAPVTIYSDVLLGKTKGFAIFISVIESAGVHEYTIAPDAFN